MGVLRFLPQFSPGYTGQPANPEVLQYIATSDKAHATDYEILCDLRVLTRYILHLEGRVADLEAAAASAGKPKAKKEKATPPPPRMTPQEVQARSDPFLGGPQKEVELVAAPPPAEPEPCQPMAGDDSSALGERIKPCLTEWRSVADLRFFLSAPRESIRLALKPLVAGGVVEEQARDGRMEFRLVPVPAAPEVPVVPEAVPAAPAPSGC